MDTFLLLGILAIVSGLIGLTLLYLSKKNRDKLHGRRDSLQIDVGDPEKGAPHDGELSR